MGHNQSQRQRRAAVLESTLADWLGAQLVLRCPRCRAERALRIEELCQAYGGGRRISAVLNRLRCGVSQCGSPPAYARIDGAPRPMSSIPPPSIMLIGPGAYD